MKAMNYVFTIAFVLIMSSCTNENPTDEVFLESTEFKGRIIDKSIETQEVFELDLHQYYLLAQINKLEAEKSVLESKIEKGSRKLIPTWESVVKEIDLNNEILSSILENSCGYLKLRQRNILMQVRSGNTSLKSELNELNKKVEECESGKSPIYIGAVAFRLIKEGEDAVGGCGLGKPEIECKHVFNVGELLVNVINNQEAVRQVVLQSEEGKVISQGKQIGAHKTINGVSQFNLKAPELENGNLIIVKGKLNYSTRVEIR
ncbi:hypothetical protein [Aurantibacter sp.]|uniref:hypothetical protein n=1 Tax=Aurantibacter sp. TaxID=2807103 RepID=UPI003267342E